MKFTNKEFNIIPRNFKGKWIVVIVLFALIIGLRFYGEENVDWTFYGSVLILVVLIAIVSWSEEEAEK